MPNICKYCGVDLDGEAEMFSRDKTFTRHSCRVIEQARKRALDHFQTQLEELGELSREWCYFQAEKDLEEE